jgi:hypothetical protein
VKPVVDAESVIAGVSGIGLRGGVVTVCDGTIVVGGRQIAFAALQMAGSVSGGVLTLSGGRDGVGPIVCDGIVKGPRQIRPAGAHTWETVSGGVVTVCDGTPGVETVSPGTTVGLVQTLREQVAGVVIPGIVSVWAGKPGVDSAGIVCDAPSAGMLKGMDEPKHAGGVTPVVPLGQGATSA